DRSREIDPDATVTSVGTGTSSETIVLANTAGPPVSYRGTYLSAGLSVLYRTDPPATGFEHMLSRSADLDPEAIADAAMEMARNSRDPVHGEGGLRRVVLRHGALSDILEFTLFPALAGERVAEGRSLLSGRLGESVAASSFTLVDRQDMPSGCGASPFDDEGIPSREIPLIERGVLRGYLHHLTSAAKHGHVSTGSALRCERWSSSRSYRAAPAAIARNVHLVPTVDDAIAEVDRGVYIVNVIGAHTSNPVSGDFSLNTNIAFEIRRGEVGRPLRPMMLSGNIADILEGTLAVGSDHHYHTGSMSGVGGYLPSIVVNELTLTP
ncbi:MAG TPA: TldD/PmbA family protein, partial [Thermoplasmata archaeon]|nr:TldD/PmbA family protein [Thermoplasmata archaeon]